MIITKKIIENSSSINTVIFSPDNKYLAFSSRDKTVKIYNINSSSIIAILKGHSAPNVLVKYSPDGKYLVSGSDDDTLKIWENKSFKLVNTVKGLGTYSLLFSPNGKYIISSTDENSEIIKIYDFESNKIVKTIKGEGSITSLSHSSDGKYLAWAASRGLYLINIKSGKIIQLIKEFYYFSSVKYSPDGKYLAAVVIGDIDNTDRDKYGGIETYKTGNDGKLEYLCYWEGSLGTNKIAYSPDGKYLTSGNFNDGAVKLWDASSGSLLKTLDYHSGRVNTIAYSPNGKYIASGGEDNIKIFEIDS